MAFSTINMNKFLLWHSLCFRPTQHLLHNRVALLPHDLPELPAQGCLKFSVPDEHNGAPHFMHVVLPHDPPELLRHPCWVLLAPEDLVCRDS
jgi:hypothetical protein